MVPQAERLRFRRGKESKDGYFTGYVCRCSDRKPVFFPEKYKKINEKLQVVCTILLIFCMGVTLGSRDHFLQELGTLGWTSFLFFLFPAGGSLLLVYGLTRKFMPSEKEKKKKEPV